MQEKILKISTVILTLTTVAAIIVLGQFPRVKAEKAQSPSIAGKERPY